MWLPSPLCVSSPLLLPLLVATLLSVAELARAQLTVTTILAPPTAYKGMDELSNRTLYYSPTFSVPYAAPGPTIWRMDFANGAYLSPVKIVGLGTNTVPVFAVAGGSLQVAIGVPKALLVLYAADSRRRSTPEGLLFAESDAMPSGRLRVHDFASQSVRVVLGNSIVGSIYGDGVGTNARLPSLSNTKLLFESRNVVWILGPMCVIQAVSTTGSYRGTNWLMSAKRRLFQCAGAQPTAANGYQDAGGEFANCVGIALWKSSSQLLAVFIVSPSAAHGLRKISNPSVGVPLVTTFFTSPAVASGFVQVEIVPGSSPTLFLADATVTADFFFCYQ